MRNLSVFSNTRKIPMSLLIQLSLLLICCSQAACMNVFGKFIALLILVIMTPPLLLFGYLNTHNTANLLPLGRFQNLGRYLSPHQNPTPHGNEGKSITFLIYIFSTCTLNLILNSLYNLQFLIYINDFKITLKHFVFRRPSFR